MLFTFSLSHVYTHTLCHIYALCLPNSVSLSWHIRTCTANTLMHLVTVECWFGWISCPSERHCPHFAECNIHYLNYCMFLVGESHIAILAVKAQTFFVMLLFDQYSSISIIAVCWMCCLPFSHLRSKEESVMEFLVAYCWCAITSSSPKLSDINTL